jgi:tRNA (guanine-N7-)-methyltransferase
MSRRNKLQKFAEIADFKNVFENKNASKPGISDENGEVIELKGLWNKNFFKTDFPICLELACGRGEYSLGLSDIFPSKNYVGVDVKGARIWRGAKNAMDQGKNNIAFLRSRIEQIDLFFAENEVSEIWIVFPDPFLKKGQENRRLTAPYFLNLYKRITKPGAKIHLKTDNDTLFDFTMEVLKTAHGVKIEEVISDVYEMTPIYPELSINTYYEKIHLKAGLTIKYVRFSFEDLV